MIMDYNDESVNLYDRLRCLQVIPDAYDRWADYRNELSMTLVSGCKAGTGVSLIGAGGCNDFDLVEMSKHFIRINLYDQDMAAMENALKRVNARLTDDNTNVYILGKCMISLFKTDFTGIDEPVYRQFADELGFFISMNYGTEKMKNLTELALNKIDEAYKNINCEFTAYPEDYVVSCGVHSQLNNMFAFIWQILMRELESKNAIIADSSRVYERISEENDHIIKSFNDQLLKITRQALFIGTEVLNRSTGSKVEGAKQCISDIWYRNEIGEIRALEKNLLWDFDVDRNIIYDMKLFYIEK